MRGNRLGFYQAKLHLGTKFNLRVTSHSVGRRRRPVDVEERRLVTHGPLHRLFLFVCCVVVASGLFNYEIALLVQPMQLLLQVVTVILAG